MADEFVLSREFYRNLKRADRPKMELFLKTLYNNGVKVGFNSAIVKRNIPFDRKELSKILLDDVKGLSVEQAEQIIAVLMKKYQLKQEAEQTEVGKCSQ